MTTPAQRPNVVLVVADDLGIGDLGAYGSDMVETRALDRLAASGLACDAMYAAGSTDTPSRAGMLTGRYGARYGLPATVRPGMAAGLPADATTFATALSRAGYVTGLFGQWRLGSGPGQHPLDHGFARFAGTLYGTDVTPLAWYEGRSEVQADLPVATATRRITREARAFVDEQYDGSGGQSRPFLAVLSHLVPHAPFQVEPSGFGKSDAGLYGDVVESFDQYVGDMVRHLEDRHSRGGNRTLVIVTSDNGPRYEGHTQWRRGRKPEVFDGGVRVPFLASWIGSSGPATRDSVPRSLLDLTPSLCALAGAPAPADLDGEDMSALLAGTGVPARGPVYLFYDEFLNAVREGKWKLHRSFGNGRVFGLQWAPWLFDLEGDVRENFNVDNLHPDVVARLLAQMDAVRTDVSAEAAARTSRENA